jgi:hypothetical protein
MAENPSLRLFFQLPYKGGEHAFSCRFHLTLEPATEGDWHDLTEAVWANSTAGLRKGMLDTVAFTEARGYSGAAHTPAVYTEDFGDTSFGLIGTSGDIQSAYIAALPYWTTDATNSRGQSIYLRNFVHGVKLASASTGAAIDSTQLAALEAFANQFSDAGGGWDVDGTVYKRCAPGGAVGLSGSCRQYPNHRVLARRG